MIKTLSQRNAPIEIDLTGGDGNAFVLLVYAKKLAYLIGLSEEEKAVLAEMKASDYENLVHVFDKHFGKFVIMYR